MLRYISLSLFRREKELFLNII